MPPSPSLRGSFRGDARGDSHKRGRSLESGLSYREKDDDLALFNELQSKEKDNFLLESTDDFEDLLSSKMKPFPELKLGLNFSSFGESSDLLNTDAEKNDYEWLLTPPETPLFTSLDDEPAHVNLVHNGRARSRPISISRSSTMEKSHRSSRGSPSPQRSSPSPRSGTGSFSGRPSSAPHSNPVSLHSTSPARRPSPHPAKPSTPPPRSLTPTPRRTVTGSPVRTSRGNSSSPTVRAWQSNIPGFSLEAPPNLRTSLVDRPASYIRGSSPASRKSMSPTPSRSVSSSHSQERDRLSSHSKGSIASSGDDDVDSLHSGPTSFSERPRKGVSGYPSGRSLGFSKKPTKTFSPSYAPKRSLDSAMRQMDRTTPQNMFRPLLSSVPSSTFYSGKTSSANCTLQSKNSSITTSSNITSGSDLPTIAAHDTEGSDLYQDDMASDCARPIFSDNRDMVFDSVKMDARPEDSWHEGHDTPSEARLSEPSKDDAVIVECNDNILICSICGSRYRPDELAESENVNICSECNQNESLKSSTLLNRLETTESSSIPLMDNSEESHVLQPLPNLPLLETTVGDSQSGETSKSALNEEDLPTQTCLGNPVSVSMEPESGDGFFNHQLMREHRTLDDPSLQGAGISVLLNRSSSAKRSFVHGRTINSSAISFEDLSYSRDLTSSMRSSIGRGSLSASSSIDLTSTRHGEMFVRRQLSAKLSDSSSKPQSTLSSFSGISVPINPSFGHSTSSRDGSFEGSLGNVLISERPTLPSVQIVALENAELYNASSLAGRGPLTEPSVGHNQNLRDLDLTVSSLVDEGTMLDNRVGQVDVEEDLPRFSLSVMSEIEINDSHPSSPGSQIDVVFREDSEGSSVAMCRDTSVKDASLESGEYDQAGSTVEGSTVTMKDQAERRKTSLTLEEATETILFCSSIIHDLAYESASIAIEKQKQNLEPLEGSRPTVTIPDKSGADGKDPRESTTGRPPNTQKARRRRTAVETEEKPPPSRNDDMPKEPVFRNVGLPKSSDSMKPPLKVESKCHCTIM